MSWLVRIGLLVGLIAASSLLVAAPEPTAKTSNVERTRLSLVTLRGGIAVFKIRTDRWPRTLVELVDAKVVDRVPPDGWGRPFLWLRPIVDSGHGCLLSTGPDGALGTSDDVAEGCDRSLLNEHLLVTAGLEAARDRVDAYGNQIQLIGGPGASLAWSFGPDGKPDTADDQVARVARRRE